MHLRRKLVISYMLLKTTVYANHFLDIRLSRLPRIIAHIVL